MFDAIVLELEVLFQLVTIDRREHSCGSIVNVWVHVPGGSLVASGTISDHVHFCTLVSPEVLPAL